MFNLSQPSTRLVFLLLVWLAFAAFGVWFWRRWMSREAVERRIWAHEDAMASAATLEEDGSQRGYIGRWLYLAGFRSRGATGAFITASILCAGMGALFVFLMMQSGMAEQAVQAAQGVPGGAGDLARPVLLAAPWILLVFFALIPWVIVNEARKRRVLQVEQDLPVTLELLATMSESGLGFDSALDKIVESEKAERPLFQELRTFQIEVLGGISRVQCFRRLARRLEVASMSVFVSALVQAEQVGAGFANVLRAQADDLRNRRREDADTLAQKLPVKLIFPLVICFLPGIFVTTLGPIFLQFIKMADSMMQR